MSASRFGELIMERRTEVLHRQEVVVAAGEQVAEEKHADPGQDCGQKIAVWNECGIVCLTRKSRRGWDREKIDVWSRQ